MITRDEVLEAFAMLHRAREEVYQAAKSESDANHALKDAEFCTLMDGSIDGKNDKMRDAQLALKTDSQRWAFHAAEEKNSLAEMNLKQCKDRCLCWRPSLERMNCIYQRLLFLRYMPSSLSFRSSSLVR